MQTNEIQAMSVTWVCHDEFTGWRVKRDWLDGNTVSKDEARAIEARLYNHEYVMNTVCPITNPELGKRVIGENRLFTKGEVVKVIDDLASSIMKNVNIIIELRRLIEIELRNVGIPCYDMIRKCQEVTESALRYVEPFERLIRRTGSGEADIYFWPIVLSKALEKFNRLINYFDADLIAAPDEDFYDYDDLLKPIPPKQALDDALKMIDYFQLILNEISKYSTLPQLAPNLDSVEGSDKVFVDFIENPPIVNDTEFIVLKALYLLKQPYAVGHVGNKVREFDKYFDDSKVSKICSRLNTELKFARTDKKQWSITQLGISFVTSDYRFTSFQDDTK